MRSYHRVNFSWAQTALFLSLSQSIRSTVASEGGRCDVRFQVCAFYSRRLVENVDVLLVLKKHIVFLIRPTAATPLIPR